MSLAFSERVRAAILARLQELQESGIKHPMTGVERACHRYFGRILRGEKDYLETSLPRADSILNAHYRCVAMGKDAKFQGLHHNWVNVLAAIVLYIQSHFSTFNGSGHLFLLLAEELLDSHGRDSYRGKEAKTD